MMIQLGVSILLAIALNYLPGIGKIFKGFNTLIHETGHALMSLIFSGEVVSIDIFYSGEGVATTKSKSWFSKFFISIAGYTFSSFVAFLFIYLIHKGYDQTVLYIFLSIVFINLIFWVRNVYGIIWLLSIVTITVLFFYFQWNTAIQYFTYIITACILVDAYVSSWHIFYLSIKDSKKSGDARNLQQIAWLHSSIWGFLFFLQANVFLLLSIHLFHPIPFLTKVLGNLSNLL